MNKKTYAKESIAEFISKVVRQDEIDSIIANPRTKHTLKGIRAKFYLFGLRATIVGLVKLKRMARVVISSFAFNKAKLNRYGTDKNSYSDL